MCFVSCWHLIYFSVRSGVSYWIAGSVMRKMETGNIWYFDLCTYLSVYSLVYESSKRSLADNVCGISGSCTQGLCLRNDGWTCYQYHEGRRISFCHGTPALSEEADHSYRSHAALSAGYQEDWHYIKDAMRLRDVSPTLISFLKAPAMTVNCIYVPMLTAASKTADELSIASVTRGIENPKPRTCLVEIRMRVADWAVMVLFAVFLASEIVWKVVGI